MDKSFGNLMAFTTCLHKENCALRGPNLAMGKTDTSLLNYSRITLINTIFSAAIVAIIEEMFLGPKHQKMDLGFHNTIDLDLKESPALSIYNKLSL